MQLQKKTKVNPSTLIPHQPRIRAAIILLALAVITVAVLAITRVVAVAVAAAAPANSIIVAVSSSPPQVPKPSIPVTTRVRKATQISPLAVTSEAVANIAAVNITIVVRTVAADKPVIVIIRTKELPVVKPAEVERKIRQK